MLWGNNDGFISKFSAPAAREIISRCTFTIFFCSTLTCPSVPSTDTIIYFSNILYRIGFIWHDFGVSTHEISFYRWFHIKHVPSVSRVLVRIKSVIHERSETSIPRSKNTIWTVFSYQKMIIFRMLRSGRRCAVMVVFKNVDCRNWAKIFYFFLPRAVLKTALGSFFI